MISVVIPTYNRLNQLKRCLNSVLNQKQNDIEIIVVDDCSNDDTWQYLKELAVVSNNIKIILNNANAGVNYTRNRGIEIASKPFILFLDSDDSFIPNTIERSLVMIKEYPNTNHFLSFLSYRAGEFSEAQKPSFVRYEQWVSGEYNGDFTHIVRTDIMKQYLFFEEFRMFEQLNWYRIFCKTSPQLLLPFALIDVNLESTDSLMKATQTKSWEAVHASFSSEAKFYELYFKDLIKYNPKYLKLKLVKNIFLGMACGERLASQKLIKYSKGFHIKTAAIVVTILPFQIARYVLLKSGRVR